MGLEIVRKSFREDTRKSIRGDWGTECYNWVLGDWGLPDYGAKCRQENPKEDTRQPRSRDCRGLKGLTKYLETGKWAGNRGLKGLTEYLGTGKRAGNGTKVRHKSSREYLRNPRSGRLGD